MALDYGGKVKVAGKFLYQLEPTKMTSSLLGFISTLLKLQRGTVGGRDAWLHDGSIVDNTAGYHEHGKLGL